MKHLALYLICLVVVVVYPYQQAQGQIFDDFGPPTSIPVSSDVISMSVENTTPEERLDEESTLWLLNNSGNVSSSDGHSFPASVGSKAIAVGKNQIFLAVNKMITVVDTITTDTSQVNTYWLEEYSKTGSLLQSNRIFGSNQFGLPIRWPTNGGITALTLYEDSLFFHLNGGYSEVAGVYHCSYVDSVWAEYRFWPACNSGILIRPFGLLRDSTTWLVSDTSLSNRGIFIYPNTAQGFTYSTGSENPGIGSVLAMSGTVENLFLLARDNGVVTVYHYQSAVSADERWPKERAQTSFEMFPNPTNGWIKIAGLDNKEHQISIYNALGQRVVEFTFWGTGRRIELPPSCSSGFFLIKVDGYSTKKLLLIR